MISPTSFEFSLKSNVRSDVLQIQFNSNSYEVDLQRPKDTMTIYDDAVGFEYSFDYFVNKRQ